MFLNPYLHLHITYNVHLMFRYIVVKDTAITISFKTERNPDSRI